MPSKPQPRVHSRLLLLPPLWGLVWFLTDPELRARDPAVTPSLDTLRGTASDDVLRGTPRNDFLDGAAGDDWLTGREGDDVLRGGAGRDVLDGGPGDDVLEGGEGWDLLDGGDGRDWLFGEDGEDRLLGGAGPDVLDGGPDRDELHGGDGNDLLDGGAGDDAVTGGADNDVLDGGDGFDFLDGGAGSDNLDGGDENDVLLGGVGADTLQGGDGDDQLDGGADNDLLMGDDGDDVLRGGGGHDALAGRDGNDFLDGGLGDDLLNGGDGDDVLSGGAGADTLLGFGGADQLRGGLGSDIVRGGDGDDVLDGDDGDDVLTGGTGTDVIAGGDGNDVIHLRAGDVDSGRVEIIDGGTNRDTARVDADTVLLNGFKPTDLARVDSLGRRTVQVTDPFTGGTYALSRIEHVVYLHVVPYVVGGEPSLLQLVNPFAADVAGRAEFVDSAGRPMNGTAGSDSARSTHPFRLPPSGRVELTVRPPMDGAVRLYADRPISTVLRTTLPGGGGGVVFDNSVLDAFVVPVTINRQRGITSGFAVANGAVGTALRITLYLASGPEVEATEFEVPSHGQAVLFAHQLFPRFETFDGKLIVQGGPMAAVGLQVLAEAAATVSAPVLPVAPRPPLGALRIPHVVSGDGYATTILLLGLPPDSAKNGRVAFFDDDGNPLALDIAGVGSVTELPFAVAPGGTVAVTTTGRGPVAQGSAVVTLGGGNVAATARLTLPGFGTVEAQPTRGVRGFVTGVRRDAAQGLSTLVAVSAVDSPTTIEFTLRDPSGRAVRGGRARIELKARAHTAILLEQLFRRADTQGFGGTLVATASGGMVAPLVLEVGPGGSRGVALPVTPLP